METSQAPYPCILHPRPRASRRPGADAIRRRTLTATARCCREELVGEPGAVPLMKLELARMSGLRPLLDLDVSCEWLRDLRASLPETSNERIQR